MAFDLRDLIRLSFPTVLISHSPPIFLSTYAEFKTDGSSDCTLCFQLTPCTSPYPHTPNESKNSILSGSKCACGKSIVLKNSRDGGIDVKLPKTLFLSPIIIISSRLRFNLDHNPRSVSKSFHSQCWSNLVIF